VITPIERFEAIGDLYYRRHHRLRPGKAEAPETGRFSSDEENCTQFDSWFATQAFSDAVARIIELENELENIKSGTTRY
jgi:hypothetical protein